MDLKTLKQTNRAIQEALEVAREKRNEEDRKYIVSSIGQDLVKILQPLLEKVAENSRLTRDDIKDIVSKIKVESPSVSVNSETPRAEVKVDIPDIRTDGIEKTIDEAIKKGFSKVRVSVPKPEVTVEPAPVKMPGEMEVKGLKGFISKLLKRLDKPFRVEFEKEDVQKVILSDDEGQTYKALSYAVGGGGGRGVVTATKATGSKIDQLLLANPAKWYALTMPSTMVSLDMFLSEQGAKCYYRWDSPEDETNPRMPIFPGYSRRMVDAKFGGRKMYVTSPTANQTIVVEYFLGE